jgi:hypothetical protein
MKGRMAQSRKRHRFVAKTGACPPVDRFDGHPVLREIVEHCAKLGAQARQLVKDSSEQGKIERRIRALDSYTLPRLYERGGDYLDDVAIRFRKILRESGLPEKRIDQEERLYRKRLTARPKGPPVLKRRQYREGYEQKLAHPRDKWREIAQSVGLEKGDLERGVRRLKALLKSEGINVKTSTRIRRRSPR